MISLSTIEELDDLIKSIAAKKSIDLITLLSSFLSRIYDHQEDLNISIDFLHDLM